MAIDETRIETRDMTRKHAATMIFVEIIQKYLMDEDAIKYFEQLRWGNVNRNTQDRLDDLFRAMIGKTIMYEGLTA